MARIHIWPGSSSFAETIEPTPFGFYDNDSDFREDADKISTWIAARLGYPLVDVELRQINFYTCFEESVSEYGAQVYNFQILNNFYTIQGTPTGSNLNQTNVDPSLGASVTLANNYGNQVAGGQYGTTQVHSGSLIVKAGTQKYDLHSDMNSTISGSKNIKIKKIYHHAPAAINRYFDPYAGTGTGIQSLMQSFGMGNMSPGVNFMLMPIYFDVLKLQAIEFNDQIRKSAYHFEINSNRYLRLFPIPKANYKLWFDYTLNEDNQDPTTSSLTGEAADVAGVTDISNAPYENPTYKFINGPGRQWIRKYALALAKEMLGGIRGKYQSIPIPGAETTLDYSRLLSEAADEKSELKEELRGDLVETTRVKQLERQNEEANLAQQNFDKIPFQIFVG
tara:strand:+ start:99 stop:1277 length:1179 start_codon:yes stop_codon:yes gene_type:complete